MSDSQYKPDDFLPALGVTQDDTVRPILIGGQAVNFWAQLYAPKLSGLKALQPFLSKDCDVYGDRATARRMQRKSGWTIRLFAPREVAVAALIAEDGRTVEVLNAVRGLTARDLDRMCVRIQVGVEFLWVLNPIALLKAKLANVAELDQTQRNDRRHVLILIPVVREFLRQALSYARGGAGSQREVIALLEAVLKTATAKNAEPWRDAFGKNLESLFPLKEIKIMPLAKVRNFADKRLLRSIMRGAW